MSNKILSTLNIGNNSYEIDDAFARQKIEEVDNNLLKINPVYSTSGSVVSFDNGADNLPLEELIVDINPVQDLHGYDHPWIGGSGNNLWGGKKMADDIINALSGAIINETANTISIPIGIEVEVVLTNNITFKENTRYTYILSQTDTSSSNANLMFVYTDGTNDRTLNRYMQAGANVSAEGKTVAGIMGRYYSGTTVIKYKESGLFEGVLTVDEFEPYENICPITGWTGMNISKHGKNLFNQSLMKDQVGWNIIKIYAPIGTELIMSTNQTSSSTSGLMTYLMYANGTQGENECVYLNHPVKKIVPQIGYVQVAQRNRDNITSVTDWNYQIEIGNVATEYEPYNGTGIPISWETEAGTVYGGSLDVLTGVLTVDKACIYLGSLGWNKSSAGNKYYASVTPQYDKTKIPNMICSEYRVDGNGTSARGYYGENGTIRYWVGSSHYEFYIVDDRYTTVADFTQGVANSQVCYDLENPITYQLTPHEVKSLLGQNNIFTDINSKNILVSYKASILKYIDKAKSTIFFGQCDPTSTATKFTAQIDGITEYFDGLTILLKNGFVASQTGCTFNINGLGEKGAWGTYDVVRVATAFTVTRIYMFIYDSALDGGNGGWWMYQGKDANDNSVGYIIRTTYSSLPVTSDTGRYRILFTSADKKHYVPPNNNITSSSANTKKDVCQEKIDPFGKIVYYNSTTTLHANDRPVASSQWLQYYFNLGFSFNRTDLPLALNPWEPVYIKATPYADGSAIIDADEPITQDLPTAEDNKIYIHLGIMYSGYAIELSLNHPVYHYHNGAIQLWTGPESFTDDYKNKIDALWADYQSRIGQ